MVDTARIIITRDCNLYCPYCCNERPEIYNKFRRLLSLEKVPWQNYKSVCITGGEPLLRVDRILEVVRFANQHGCKKYLYTNGTMLTPNYLDFLLDNFEFDGVNIGLHEGVLVPYSVLAHEKVRVSMFDTDKRYMPVKANIKRINECDTPNEHIYDWVERRIK